MGKEYTRKRVGKFRAIVLPIIMVVCFLAAFILFYQFFVKGPENRVENIKKLIEENKNVEAAELLYGFTYKEYADGKLLEEVCADVPELKLYTLKEGDTFKFGRYEQDGDLNNGEEKIKWEVLEKDGGKLLVRTVKVIEERAYHRNVSEDGGENYFEWKDTTLYSFLNGKFIDNAFNDVEKNLIVESSEGKVFITADEKDFFGAAEPTNFVCLNYAPKVAADGLTSVWLRSESAGMICFSSSTKDSYGNQIWTRTSNDASKANERKGVRPAMWIKIGSLAETKKAEGEGQ